MLYVALIDNQSVAINMLKMNLITLSLWLESTKREFNIFLYN